MESTGGSHYGTVIQLQCKQTYGVCTIAIYVLKIQCSTH